jgi:ABC-2 type transport system ATP-binding protein
VDEARRLFPEATVDDDLVSLTIATREPATVLSTLAERNALKGLGVSGATLEDVFLQLTGREYRV